MPDAIAFTPSTSWRETIQPGEQELVEDFTRRVILSQQQEIAMQTGEAPMRGFHAKLHAGVAAEFRVLEELPFYACHGVFGVPHLYPAVVRFSNGKPSREADRHPEPRGLALKLIGVPGDKLTPGRKDDLTQDFLATSHSVTSVVRDARQFMAFVEAERTGPMLPFHLARSLGIPESARILTALGSSLLLNPVRSVATEEYSGTAPIKLGPYAVKFTLRPAPGTPEATEREESPDFLRQELEVRLRKAAVNFDFLVQFYVDEHRTPIEDTSIPWEAHDSPFLKIADLRIPCCDLSDPVVARLSETINRMSFSPWHTIEDHRPLGNIMRARRVAYQLSATLRGHSAEPLSMP